MQLRQIRHPEGIFIVILLESLVATIYVDAP